MIGASAAGVVHAIPDTAEILAFRDTNGDGVSDEDVSIDLWDHLPGISPVLDAVLVSTLEGQKLVTRADQGRGEGTEKRRAGRRWNHRQVAAVL